MVDCFDILETAADSPKNFNIEGITQNAPWRLFVFEKFGNVQTNSHSANEQFPFVSKVVFSKRSLTYQPKCWYSVSEMSVLVFSQWWIWRYESPEKERATLVGFGSVVLGRYEAHKKCILPRGILCYSFNNEVLRWIHRCIHYFPYGVRPFLSLVFLSLALEIIGESCWVLILFSCF